MRHSATHSLLTRDDVIIVASVSCIYGLGTARGVRGHGGDAGEGRGAAAATRCMRQLVDCQYERNDVDFHRGTFRVRGDTVEIFPVYEEDRAVRVEFFGDTVERISEFDPLRGVTLGDAGEDDHLPRQPLRHRAATSGTRRSSTIRGELQERLARAQGAEQAGRGAAARAAHACSTSR